jgi:hypothetical protein
MNLTTAPAQAWNAVRRTEPIYLWNELIDFSEEKLAAIDPVVMNLAVAKGILPLADLNIPAYQRTIDLWAKDIERRLPEWMEEFSRRPQDWNNDVDEFRLGLVSYYVAKFLGVRYIEEQRGAVHVAYTNPSDLFLNGVMDTRRGACGNMALLQVVLGRRLGWPVSVATARWHEFYVSMTANAPSMLKRRTSKMGLASTRTVIISGIMVCERKICSSVRT